MLPGRIDLISSSDVQFPFGSLETLQVLAGNLLSIPSSFTEVPIHLDLASEDNSDSNTTAGAREFYFTASVWSLDSSLAPPACVLPSLSTVYPGQNASKLERDITIIHVFNNDCVVQSIGVQVYLSIFPALEWAQFSCSFV